MIRFSPPLWSFVISHRPVSSPPSYYRCQLVRMIPQRHILLNCCSCITEQCHTLGGESAICLLSYTWTHTLLWLAKGESTPSRPPSEQGQFCSLGIQPWMPVELSGLFRWESNESVFLKKSLIWMMLHQSLPCSESFLLMAFINDIDLLPYSWLLYTGLLFSSSPTHSVNPRPPLIWEWN